MPISSTSKVPILCRPEVPLVSVLRKITSHSANLCRHRRFMMGGHSNSLQGIYPSCREMIFAKNAALGGELGEGAVSPPGPINPCLVAGQRALGDGDLRTIRLGDVINDH